MHAYWLPVGSCWHGQELSQSLNWAHTLPHFLGPGGTGVVGIGGGVGPAGAGDSGAGVSGAGGAPDGSGVAGAGVGTGDGGPAPHVPSWLPPPHFSQPNCTHSSSDVHDRPHAAPHRNFICAGECDPVVGTQSPHVGCAGRQSVAAVHSDPHVFFGLVELQTFFAVGSAGLAE